MNTELQKEKLHNYKKGEKKTTNNVTGKSKS